MNNQIVIKDIYEMSKEDNIFAAKRIMVDSIYASANLEGIGVTFAQTTDILNNVNVDEVTPKDMMKVFCLRDAWKYVLDNIDKNLDLVFLQELHEIVAKADVEYYDLGRFRRNEVMISGTDWRPVIPNAEDIINKLDELSKIAVTTDRAIKTGLALMRIQPFRDGNKRIGSFVINKLLIQNGKGLFKVPVRLDGKFKELLVKYYETDDYDVILEFIRDNCIVGLNKID